MSAQFNSMVSNLCNSYMIEKADTFFFIRAQLTSIVKSNTLYKFNYAERCTDSG